MNATTNDNKLSQAYATNVTSGFTPGFSNSGASRLSTKLLILDPRNHSGDAFGVVERHGAKERLTGVLETLRACDDTITDTNIVLHIARFLPKYVDIRCIPTNWTQAFADAQQSPAWPSSKVTFVDPRIHKPY